MARRLQATPNAWFPRFSLRLSERRILLVSGDALLALFVALAAFWLWELRSSVPLSLFESRTRYYWLTSLVLLWVFSSLMAQLYHLRIAIDRGEVVRRIVWLAGVHLGLYLILFFLSPPASLPRFVFVVYLALLIPLVSAWRILYANITILPPFRRRALIVGAGWAGQSIADAIRQNGGAAYELVGFVDDNRQTGEDVMSELAVVGSGAELVGIAERTHTDEIILAITGPLEGRIYQALADCRERGVIVERMETLYEALLHRVPVEHMGRDWAIISSDGLSVHRSHQIVKRLFDVVFGLMGTAGLVLILPIIAIAIRLDSAGPVFYRQARLGRGGRTFYVLKFRTMFQDSDQRYGVKRTVALDARVTRVGRFLRRTRLNELPQVFNVLMGDMSFVGPRPELPDFVAQVQDKIPFYRTRLLVKPGITGWAQINYGHGALVEDALIKLQYDLYYIKHWSPLLDLYIIAKTIGVVLATRGL